jgi:hypothetical protein
MTSSPWTGEERRRQGRLRDGDRKRCPDCGGQLEFRERFRVLSNGRKVRTTPEPAWSCITGCGYREFVRHGVNGQ